MKKSFPFQIFSYSSDIIKEEVSVWYKYVFMTSGYSPGVKIW